MFASTCLVRAPARLSVMPLLLGSLVAQDGHAGGDGLTHPAPARQPLSAPGVTPGTDQLTAPSPLSPGWHVPIHTQGEDPVGGSYGTWAGERTFKASFHDGFVFYPFLGAGYARNLPVRWTTESVTAGGEPFIDCTQAPRHASTATRYEYRFDGMTEGYDVRADGVEQTFVFANRPVNAGDLIVSGRVVTELTAAATAAAKQALVFHDSDGKAIVHYGEAVAIDSTGRRFDVSTAYDGTHLCLIVPAAAVAAAAFPLVIDPLVARVIISATGSSGAYAVFPAIAREGESQSSNVMVFYSRQFSATDFDGYAQLTNDDFGNGTLIYSDITTAWSTAHASVAFVGAADRWVLCLERRFVTPTTARIRVLFHDKGNTILNSGLLVSHDPSSGECNWFPAVGGTISFSISGATALLAYQADVSSTISDTPDSRVYALLCNASLRALGSRFPIDNGTVSPDNQRPDVNQEANGGTTSWIVAYEQRNNLIVNDDVDVQVARVTSTGTVAGHAFVGPSAGTPIHKHSPQVSGRNGRYCVSMLRSNSPGGFGDEIMVERFDWSEGAPTPTKLGPITVVAGPPGELLNGDLAFDDNSASHWTLVYERNDFLTSDCHVLRVGGSGSPTETAQLGIGSYAAWPAVTFNDDLDEFQCVYGTLDNGLPLYGQRFLYPAAAQNVAYGSGCGPGTITATAPYAGSEFFHSSLGGVPAGTIGVLFVSGGPSAIPLTVLGMTGCTSLIDLNAQLGSIVAVTPATAGFALPDNPLFLGDVHAQWVYFSIGLNPAGLGATSALRIQVR